MRLLLLSALLVFATASSASSRDETWMSVTLGGRKIGQMQNLRELRDGRVYTTQTLDVRIERAGIGIGMQTSETSEESPAGEPLGFSARSKLSGIETRIDGKVADGTAAITSMIGGATQSTTQPWPKGALLAEGLRLAALRAGLKPGTKYRDLVYQPSSTDAIAVDTRVVGRETVDLPGGRRSLHRLEQDIALPGMPIHSVAWVDDEFDIRKLVMPVLGFQLEMIACDRACAQAPNQSADMLQHALMPAPRALERAELDRGMIYTLSPRDPKQAIDMPVTAEQRIEHKGPRLRVHVTAKPRANGDVPVAADRSANAWLQSDAPELVALAKQASADADGATQKMERLESFVRSYIDKKNLGVGYASALEVVKSREGDCTEHAVLLAALGRAIDIPTRVVDGLAYAGSFGGADQVFVPHAWVQAYVDGRWHSYDAALNGFDAGHIALGVGDGDPWRFYAGISTLGNLTLDRVDPLPAP